MKRFIPAFIAFAFFSFQFANAQTFANQLSKDSVEERFVQEVQRQGLSFKNAYHQFLSDSLAVISCDLIGRNGFGQTVTQPAIFYCVLYHENGKEFYWKALYSVKDFGITPPLFFDIEHPYITKDKMMSQDNKFSLFSKMTYEDAMYYRFMYYIGLQNMKGSAWSEDDRQSFLNSYFRGVKTGFWICKSELDEFGDPVGVSLSCPFYTKKMQDGNVDKENVEFFLNISANNIRFIPGPFQYFSSLNKYVLTIKDASGNQLKCSLDDKLNITSNASSFLRFIERDGIIKGSIAQEKGGVSYVFSLYANGYNAAKKAVNLSTNNIADLVKKNEQVKKGGGEKAESLSKQEEAIQKAKRVLSRRPTSKVYLVKVLTSAGVTQEDANFAVEHCGANWKEQAVLSAKNYLLTMAYSKSRLISQLTFEGFTKEEANYGADNCDADWRKEAVRSAKSYASDINFNYSKQGLIKHLVFDGFSNDDASYAVEHCDANWKRSACRAAEIYVSTIHLTKQEVKKQLEYEGFTSDEVDYAMKNADVDW